MENEYEKNKNLKTKVRKMRKKLKFCKNQNFSIKK